MSALLIRCNTTIVDVTLVNKTYTFEIPTPIYALFNKQEVAMMPGCNPRKAFCIFIDMCIGIVPWSWNHECTEALRLLLNLMPLDHVIKTCRVVLERRYGTEKVTAVAVALATGCFDNLGELYDSDYLDDAIANYVENRGPQEGIRM